MKARSLLRLALFTALSAQLQGGDGEVAADLEQLVAGRTIQGRPVAIRRVAESRVPADIHVLYLGPRREARLREARDAVSRNLKLGARLLAVAQAIEGRSR